MIRARKPNTDDAELIRLIRSELIPLSHTARPLDARLIRELPNRFRTGATYVATVSRFGPPIGFVHCDAVNGQLLIDMLVTHPEHRRHGWGKQLMAYAEAYGQSRHCHIARLYVDAINDRAFRFYQRLGYIPMRYDSVLRCYELIKPLPYTASQEAQGPQGMGMQ